MNWQVKSLLAMIIFGTTFAGGYRAAENKLQPIINERDAQLLAVDLKAKADEKTYKENMNVVKTKDAQYRDAIDRYKRMLSETSDNYGSNNTAKNPPGVDKRPEEQTLSGCPRETESDLFDDIRVMSGMVEFFRINKFPIDN